ncbi:hypothetical protein U9M48_037305 [Paspalum notatum var. saurae]
MLIYYLYYNNHHAPFDTDEADDAGLHRLMDTDEAMDDADTPTSTPTPSHARRSEAKTEDDNHISLIGDWHARAFILSRMLTPCPGEACTPIGARSPSLFRYTSPSGGSFILMCSTPTKRRERYFHNPG